MFRLAMGRRTVECQLWSHHTGWELRLVASDDVLQSRVCQSQVEVDNTVEGWKLAMMDEGSR